MIALAVVVAYILGPAGRRKQALHTVLERNPEEEAVPIVVHTEAAGVVLVVHKGVVVAHREAAGVVLVAHREAAGVAVPIVVHKEAAEVVLVARMAVVVAHKEAAEVAVPNLAVGLDHKTWIIPSCQICNRF